MFTRTQRRMPRERIEAKLRRGLSTERDHQKRLTALADAVNSARRTRGLDSVPMHLIEDLDECCTGADWAAKFALRASRVAVGESW